jgi:hypothetical protein
MPTAEDIDAPAALVARLTAQARGEAPVPDEMDDALARLLEEETREDRPDAADDGEGDGPADPRPV